jgi:T-complex protein 1 subunit eta
MIKINELSIGQEGELFRQLLEKCAGTALNSKLIARQKHLFAPMVVDAVTLLDPETLDIRLIGIKKITGGSVTDSQLVEGVAFKKTFSYAGFEQQPKHLKNPGILLLNLELELKSEKENAEVRITDPDQYQSIVDAEWQIIYEKLDKCIDSGAKVVLSRLPVRTSM